MKFGDLRSIGHNIADSLASGCGLLIGVYDMDVFGEAERSTEGFIEVNFLTGTSAGAPASSALAGAIILYRDALPSFCEKHGASPFAFRQLSARYSGGGLARRFSVTVQDCAGHCITDDYEGIPGRRILVLDALGRIRRKPGSRVGTITS